MTLLQILPLIAYLGVIVVILRVATRQETAKGARWLGPASLAIVFLGVSALTVAQDGLLQFWVNHTTSLSGNQVWFDLLFAVTMTFCLLAPRARAVGMSLLPWGIAVILTACIALLPMFARVLWLEDKARANR